MTSSCIHVPVCLSHLRFQGRAESDALRFLLAWHLGVACVRGGGALTASWSFTPLMHTKLYPAQGLRLVFGNWEMPFTFLPYPYLSNNIAISIPTLCLELLNPRSLIRRLALLLYDTDSERAGSNYRLLVSHLLVMPSFNLSICENHAGNLSPWDEMR